MQNFWVEITTVIGVHHQQSEQINRKQFYILFQNSSDFHLNYILICIVITHVIDTYFSSKSGAKPALVYILKGTGAATPWLLPGLQGEQKDIFVDVFLWCEI